MNWNTRKKGHPELIRELEEAGAEVLEKEYVDLTVGGVKLRLGGMYEYAFGLNGNNDALAAPGRRTGLSPGIPDTDRLKIMMSHRPDSFIFGDASQVWDIDLVISAPQPRRPGGAAFCRRTVRRRSGMVPPIRARPI